MKNVNFNARARMAVKHGYVREIFQTWSRSKWPPNWWSNGSPGSVHQRVLRSSAIHCARFASSIVLSLFQQIVSFHVLPLLRAFPQQADRIEAALPETGLVCKTFIVGFNINSCRFLVFSFKSQKAALACSLSSPSHTLQRQFGFVGVMAVDAPNRPCSKVNYITSEL